MELTKTDRKIEFVLINGRKSGNNNASFETITAMELIDRDTLVFGDKCPLTFLGDIGMRALDLFLDQDNEVREILSEEGGTGTTHIPQWEILFSTCEFPLTRKLPSGTTTGEEEYRPYYAVVDKIPSTIGNKVKIVEVRHIRSYLSWRGTSREFEYFEIVNKLDLED